MFLYQHSPRCTPVLQLFLDNNPEYWCLVPMLWQDARVNDNASSAADETEYLTFTRPLPPVSPGFIVKPQFFEEVFRNSTRSREECVWLAKSIPKSPANYRFSRRQVEAQIDFSKFKKERHILPSNLIDCFNNTIIAVRKYHFLTTLKIIVRVRMIVFFVCSSVR